MMMIMMVMMVMMVIMVMMVMMVMMVNGDDRLPWVVEVASSVLPHN